MKGDIGQHIKGFHLRESAVEIDYEILIGFQSRGVNREDRKLVSSLEFLVSGWAPN